MRELNDTELQEVSGAGIFQDITSALAHDLDNAVTNLRDGLSTAKSFSDVGNVISTQFDIVSKSFATAFTAFGNALAGFFSSLRDYE